MTPTIEQIEQAAREYANTPPINAKSSEIVGFIAGAKWALQEISNLEETGWISVDERLPDGAVNGVSVFIQTINEFGLQEICAYDSELRIWINRKYGNKITHWQALPKPPHQ